jgi:hypothetical protein
MSELIEVESIKRLSIKSGETLVLQLPESMDMATVEATQDRVLRELPDWLGIPDVRLLVLHGDIELTVISEGADDAAEDA